MIDPTIVSIGVWCRSGKAVEMVQRAVQDLPADFRKAIALHALEGLSYKESRPSPEFQSLWSCRHWRARERLLAILGASAAETEDHRDVS